MRTRTRGLAVLVTGVTATVVTACGSGELLGPAKPTPSLPQPTWVVDHTDEFGPVAGADGSPTTLYAVYCVAQTDYLPNESAAGRDVTIQRVEVSEQVFNATGRGTPCPPGDGS